MALLLLPIVNSTSSSKASESNAFVFFCFVWQWIAKICFAADLNTNAVQKFLLSAHGTTREREIWLCVDGSSARLLQIASSNNLQKINIFVKSAEFPENWNFAPQATWAIGLNSNLMETIAFDGDALHFSFDSRSNNIFRVCNFSAKCDATMF